MSDSGRIMIYWANSLFGLADREFNEKCVRILRDNGYEVFSPQESCENNSFGRTSPTAEEIFRSDSVSLLGSDILVACIDHESVDCGVACEIGIAYAAGLYIIGLYSDIRLYREGIGRMYKNLYLLGAIVASGGIVDSIEKLLTRLDDFKSMASNVRNEQCLVTHYNSKAQGFNDFIMKVESWYNPEWTVNNTIIKAISEISDIRMILDYGCGAGQIGTNILTNHPQVTYVGYDNSPDIIRIANQQNNNANLMYTSNWDSVVESSHTKLYDLVILSFVIHDNLNGEQIFERLDKCIAKHGFILLIDLTTWDLPRLVQTMRKELLQPIGVVDNRLDAEKLNSIANSLNCTISYTNISSPIIRFETKNDLQNYMEFFGIYNGMDLPLGITDKNYESLRYLINTVVDNISYPFIDCRSFLISMLRRNI